VDFDDVRARLATVSAITVTPFAESGAIDGAALAAMVDRLVSAGVTAVTANGSTGEFYALSPDERRLALKTTIDASDGRALVIAGIGLDLATAIDDGRFARDHGAAAVMIHQPVHPFQSAEGWTAYHTEIARALPNLAIVPYVRDPSITTEMLMCLSRCGNVVAVKYAVPDPLAFASLVAAIGRDRLTWICGVAEGWAPFFWPAGAAGFTSGLVNVVPRLSLDLLARLRTGDYPGAMAIWQLFQPFEAMRARNRSANNVSVVKEALAQLGLCRRGVRPPIGELSQAERAQVATSLLAMGGHA
jgi:4-hydroxy-tetrahydrodipicolinate synthase